MAGTEELTRIHKRIDSMAEDIGSIKGSVGTLAATFEPVNRAVMGNGQEPMAVRMAKTEEQVKTVAKETKDLKGNRDKWFWETAKCVVAVIVGVMITAAGVFFHALGG